MTDDPALQKQLHSWPFRFFSSFRLRFIHFLIPRPFSTHSVVAMATPAAGDYNRYLLKPSLINAGLSHFRNDVLSGAPYVMQEGRPLCVCVCFAYMCIVYFIIRKNILFLNYLLSCLYLDLIDIQYTKMRT